MELETSVEALRAFLPARDFVSSREFYRAVGFVEAWSSEKLVLFQSLGTMPPMLGGEALGDRFDVVVHRHGLEPFDTEFARAREMIIDGVPIRVLPLERIIAASAQQTGRAIELSCPLSRRHSPQQPTSAWASDSADRARDVAARGALRR